MATIKKRKIHSKKVKKEEDIRRGQEGMDTEGPSPQRSGLSVDPRGILSDTEIDIIQGQRSKG